MQNATALPAPRCRACLKSSPSRFVRKYRCKADVQMMRTRVIVWGCSGLGIGENRGESVTEGKKEKQGDEGKDGRLTVLKRSVKKVE